MSEKTDQSFWKSFGPGILFAGAAIGNSHLVQSTRAGALFGLGLIGLVVLANALKYPAFRFGPQYAVATGRSILSGYRQLGRWVVAIFALSEVFVMAIIIAATAITTAAVGLAITGADWNARYVAVAVTLIGGAVLWIGGYSLLDRMTKVFVATLTLATIVATALAIPSVDWSIGAFALPQIDFKTFAFIIALLGFMPAALSLGVLQSLWVVAKAEESGQRPNQKQAMLDFNIGYMSSAFLAVCFLVMGAGVMHPAGIEPATNGAQFAAQVISLYTTNLGEWSGVFVGASAMMVMFTTLVTLLDGFPRALGASAFYLRTDGNHAPPKLDGSKYMIGASGLILIGAVLILVFFMRSFSDFIDFVTITAFIVAPFTAIINHIAITRSHVPESGRPAPFLHIWSVLGILALSSLSAGFLYLQITQ